MHYISFEGEGPALARKGLAHLHRAAISPGNRFLFANDSGSDRIYVLRISNAKRCRP
ncbi:beta-propeller fold lactonase family protein [Hufsiella ginkgonis]|uniref:Beta-propeller fold lactonase family protein n=1 Tax=Hufsiella ginkgonis TaxID=2695274 RepID=A0A7K1XYJ0_9SPHI|nr:beta-propeller fold lactonase family protein [Hufsiella ginkgonis]